GPGNLRRRGPRIAASAARSAAVTGSKPVLPLLFSTLSDVRKNGKIALPETPANSSTNDAQSTAVIAGTVGGVWQHHTWGLTGIYPLLFVRRGGILLQCGNATSSCYCR